jgi:hypothetical protein
VPPGETCPFGDEDVLGHFSPAPRAAEIRWTSNGSNAGPDVAFVTRRPDARNAASRVCGREARF